MNVAQKTAVTLVATAAALSGCASSGPSVYERITATPENIATTAPDPWETLGQDVHERAEGRLADGTYTGVGHGMEGLITVTLSVEDNRISCTAMTQATRSTLMS